jgi:hypothetical protein
MFYDFSRKDHFIGTPAKFLLTRLLLTRLLLTRLLLVCNYQTKAIENRALVFETYCCEITNY